MTFTIYHIPGIKVGCTANFERRKTEYPEDTVFEIIEVLEGVDEQFAGNREWFWADHFGYKRGMYYGMIAYRNADSYAKGVVTRHSKKNEAGKSIVAVKIATKMHAEKDENGKSIFAVKAAAKTFAAKDARGRSLTGVKASKTRYAEKDEQGRTIVGVKINRTINAKKDEKGRSVAAVKSAATRCAKKDERGKSVAMVKAHETRRRNKALKVLLAQGWHPPMVWREDLEEAPT